MTPSRRVCTSGKVKFIPSKLTASYTNSARDRFANINAIFLFGLIVEILGVNYGLFFGEYSYGANLGPKIHEVPFVIGLNWVLLIIATGSVSDKLIKGKEIFKILFASSLMVLIDLLIEQSAPKLDYWEFTQSPVPLSNYIWWFIFSLCFQYIFFKTVKTKEYNLSSNILVIQFLFFGMLAVFL